MAGEKSIEILLKNMQPVLQVGNYVFCTVPSVEDILCDRVIGSFREKESITIIVEKTFADEQNFEYDLVMSWITLMIHSALDGVGLTAAFSNALSNAGISCNVIAGFYHDHIFVKESDADRAIVVLKSLSENG